MIEFLKASLVGGSLLAFALFGAATAGPLEDGAAAYAHGNYAAAMRLLRSPPANGSAEAQRDIGFMYAEGQGVQRDFAQARIWFSKAAGQGDELAQYFLAVMYRDGNGVPQDNSLALAWYRKSADQGDVLAQFDIGSMYRYGKGVPEDAAQAAAWYRKAADQGHALAQSNLGVLYSTGEGVPKDDAQALIWFRKAADQGEAVAQFNLGLAYEKGGDGVTQDSAQAAVWYRKAADKGDAAAQINLGSLYLAAKAYRKTMSRRICGPIWRHRAPVDETRKLANKNRDNLVQGMSPEQIDAARRSRAAGSPPTSQALRRLRRGRRQTRQSNLWETVITSNRARACANAQPRMFKIGTSFVPTIANSLSDRVILAISALSFGLLGGMIAFPANRLWFRYWPTHAATTTNRRSRPHEHARFLHICSALLIKMDCRPSRRSIRRSGLRRRPSIGSARNWTR